MYLNVGTITRYDLDDLVRIRLGEIELSDSGISNGISSRQGLLLVTHVSPSALADLPLPVPSENLFQRLIRNPRPDSPAARERECAEMLAGLLLNAPTVRKHLLRWLAGLAGIAPSDFDNLSFEIDTEMAIGSKRDDIRIEGWDAADRRILLWTIEIKVGSWFHESSAEGWGDNEPSQDEREADPELVNQILNYDGWLARQQSESRAGFVIAMEDMARWMPRELRMPWQATSWTRLGVALAEALRTLPLSEIEAFLTSHVLGFIEKNLWRNSQMPDFRLNFNDVALIRALSSLAEETEAKVDSLVEEMGAVLETSGFALGPVRYHHKLYGKHTRSVAIQPLVATNDDGPTLYAGMGSWAGEDYLAVWIQSEPRIKLKQEFRAALLKQAASLMTEKPPWRPPQDNDPWTDLERTVPLSHLLSEPDQKEAIRAFTASAVKDLKSIDLMGIVARLFH